MQEQPFRPGARAAGSVPRPSIRGAGRLVAIGLALALLLATGSGCVTEVDGKPVPRGDQHYPFAEVEKRAPRLQEGMTKAEVGMLLGSPAEMNEEKTVWVYLPERYALLVPARALRLEFEDGRLVDHGFRAIVLGARL